MLCRYVCYQALDEPPNKENNEKLRKLFDENVKAIGLQHVEVVEEKVCRLPLHQTRSLNPHLRT
jgi:ribosomal protein S12 methylthiotransferase accessory factor YcaO